MKKIKTLATVLVLSLCICGIIIVSCGGESDKGSDSVKVEAKGRLFNPGGDPVGEFEARNIFRAEVKGLTPNTKYKYRVGGGGVAPYNITNNLAEDTSKGFIVQWQNSKDLSTQTLEVVAETKDFETDTNLWSDTYYYTTSSGAADNFSFTVVSDPQPQQSSLEGFKEMVDTFNAADSFDPDNRFYLIGGDIVNQIAAKPEEIVNYTTTANQFNKTKPIAATQGNHDTYYMHGNDAEPNNNDQYRFGEATIFNAFITFPDNGWDTNPNKVNRSQSYYFYYNKVLFIVLNTFATANEANAAPPMPDHSKQAEWLENVLKNDRDKNLSKFRVVVTHVPVLGGRNVESWLVPETRAAYGKICTDYKVDVFFSGHEHIYARTNRLKFGEDTSLENLDFSDQEGGTYYSIVSATGPKFYNINPAVQDLGWYKVLVGAIADQEPGVYVNVKVTADKLTVTAKKTDTGNVIDTYEVEAK